MQCDTVDLGLGGNADKGRETVTREGQLLNMSVFEHGKLNRIGKDYVITSTNTVSSLVCKALVLRWPNVKYIGT